MNQLLRDRRAWGLLLLAVLATTASAGTIIALSGLQRLFGLEDAAKLLLVPTLSATICAPLAGIVADFKGRWPVLGVGLVLSAAAATIGPYLGSYDMLLASQIVLGAGTAMILTAQGTLTGDYFAQPARGRLIGWQAALPFLANGALLWLAMRLLAIDPRLPFLLGALPLLLLPLLRRLLPAPGAVPRHAAPGKTRWPGIAALLLVAGAFSGLVMTMLSVHLMPIVSVVMGGNERFIETLVRALMLPCVIFAVASGWIRPWLGLRWTLTLGHVLVAAGLALMMLFGPMTVLVGAALAGAGGGLCLPSYLSGVLDVAPARFRGLLVGCVVGTGALGAALAPFVTSHYLTWYLPDFLFRLGAGLSAIFAILVFLGLPRGPVDKVTHQD